MSKTRRHPSRAEVERIRRQLAIWCPLRLEQVACLAGVPQHVTRRALRALVADPGSGVWSYMEINTGARIYCLALPFQTLTDRSTP